ncbi:MAG: hypothetical protein SGPRY_006463, partial [Prymnesium sp.]
QRAQLCRGGPPPHRLIREVEESVCLPQAWRRAQGGSLHNASLRKFDAREMGELWERFVSKWGGGEGTFEGKGTAVGLNWGRKGRGLRMDGVGGEGIRVEVGIAETGGWGWGGTHARVSESAVVEQRQRKTCAYVKLLCE